MRARVFVCVCVCLRTVPLSLPQVFSIDYGYPDSILASSLRRIPPNSSFMEIPIQSLKCRLQDAPQSDSPELTAIFESLQGAIRNPDTEIVCKLDRIVNRIYWIHLFVDGNVE